MPTTWIDLSTELRELIIDYVVLNKVAHFVPRRRARYRAAVLHKEQSNQFREHGGLLYHDLLLVSRDFITPTELNSAIFKNSTIRYARPRDLMAIKSRFGKGALGLIRKVHVDVSPQSGFKMIDGLFRVMDQLHRLERVIASGSSFSTSTNRLLDFDLAMLLEKADISSPDCVHAKELRRHMSRFVHEWPLSSRGIWRGRLPGFCCQPSAYSFERIIQYNFAWTYGATRYEMVCSRIISF